MSYPTINIDQKKVILLSGFERKGGANGSLVIKSWNQLGQAAKKHVRVRRGQVDACCVKQGRPTIPSGRPTRARIPPAVKGRHLRF